jgi:cyclohexyl-isocyanide hydratase
MEMTVMLDRRSVLAALAGVSATTPLPARGDAAAHAAAPLTLDEANLAATEAHAQLMSVPNLHMHGGETVSMLIYPGFTALDLIGPHHFLASMMGARVELVSNQPNLNPVKSDLGLAFTPDATLNSAMESPTVLFAPGGAAGTVAAMEHADTLAYLHDRGGRAKLVTSVCTGALLLAAAGLLKGRRATTHWSAHQVLADFGAKPVDARVVRDGNVITGAGVSAGLDFGLSVVEQLRGRPYAQALMLQAEYAPQPPFAGGTVASTDPRIARALEGMLSPVISKARRIALASRA